MNNIEYINGKIRISVDVDYDEKSLPYIAQAGDVSSIQLAFDVTKWKNSFGVGTYKIFFHRPSDGTAYFADCTVDGDTVIYNLTEADMQYYGTGRVQIRGLFTGNIIKMSKVWDFDIGESLVNDSPAPTPWDDVFDRIAAAAEEGVSDKFEDLTADGEMTTSQEATVEVTYDPEENNMHFVIPYGPKGDTGAAGPGIIAGGTTGQILAKVSATDYDTAWINASNGITVIDRDNMTAAQCYETAKNAYTNGNAVVLKYDSYSSDYKSVFLLENVETTDDYGYLEFVNVSRRYDGTSSYKPMNVCTIGLREETNQTPGLPSAYQEVEYIQGTGTQWIKTGYVPKSSTKLVMDFYSEYISNNNLFGTVKTNKPNATYQATLWNNSISIGLSNSTYYDLSSSSYPYVTGRYTFTYNDSGTFKLQDEDDETIWSLTASSINFGSYALTIFARGNGALIGSYKLYHMKLVENSVVVANYVPCYRKSDSVIGLYDVVSSTFFTNAGSGLFAKGEDVGENVYTWTDYGSYSIESVECKVASWSATTSNDRYPSEKLVKNNVDNLAATILEKHPLQTVTTTAYTTVNLANNDTKYITGTPTSLDLTLPVPTAGEEYTTGVSFKAGADFTMTERVPTGYVLEYAAGEPLWIEGDRYSIIYRCIWTQNDDGNTEIIATYVEVE